MSTAKHLSNQMVQLIITMVTLVGGISLVGLKTNILGLAAGSTTLSLPATVSVGVNEQFTVPITLSASGSSVVGVDVKLKFDPSLMRLSQISPVANTNTTLTTFAPITTSNTFDSTKVISTGNQTGTIQFSALAFNGGTQTLNDPYKPTAPFIVANLTFVALKSGSGTVNFEFDPAKVTLTTDSNVVLDSNTPSDALTGVTNLAVTVNTPAPSPTPDLVTGSSTTPSNGIISNPGMETSGLTGWTTNGATLTSAASSARTGTAGAVLTGTGARMSQNVASKLTANVAYTFTTWVKVNTAGNSWGTPTLRVSKYQDLGSADFGEAKAQNSTTTGWQQLKVTRTFTFADLSGAVNVGVVNFGFTGTDTIDDYNVISTSATTTTPVPTTAIPTATAAPIPTATLIPTLRPIPTLVPTTTTVPAPTNTPAATITVSGEISNQDGSSFSNSNVWIGTGGQTGSSYLGMRFTNMTIPKGATVTSATVQVRSKNAQWIEVVGNMAADNVGNSASFTSTSLPSLRSLTSAVTHSENTKWDANSWYNLESVNSLVQSVVTRADWQSGNALSIIVKGNGNQWGRKFITDAKLTVTYK